MELVTALAGRRSFLRSRDQTKLRQKLCGGPKRSKPPKSLVSLNPGEGYAGVAKSLADHLGVARAKFEALTVGRDHMRSDQSDLVTKTRQRSPPSMRRSARFQADHTPRYPGKGLVKMRAPDELSQHHSTVLIDAVKLEKAL